MTGTLIKYVIKAAIRDRLVLSFLALLVVTTCLSVFMGSTAVIEARQFTMVFAAGGLRIAGVVGMVLFVVFFIRRAFDTKDVEFLLSRPISRASFVMSHSMAFSILAAAAAILISFTLFIVVPNNTVSEGYLLWAASLLVELIIMANAAFFFSMVLTSAVSSALAVFALYVMARMMGTLLGMLDSGLTFASADLFTAVFQIISLIIPRLDLMAQTSWLVYDLDGGIGFGFVFLLGAVYTSLLVAGTCVDLKRRQF